jgi:hypothetical protein
MLGCCGRARGRDAKGISACNPVVIDDPAHLVETAPSSAPGSEGKALHDAFAKKDNWPMIQNRDNPP